LPSRGRARSRALFARAAFAAVSVALSVAGATTFALGQAHLAVASADFHPGGMLPRRAASAFCGGANVSPELHWSGAPPQTRGFVVTMFDPDARSGAGFWHWIVYDIPARVHRLKSVTNGSALPHGAAAATNDIGTQDYRGPCPPRGELHHYRFTVYALRTSFVSAQTTRRGPTIVRRITPYLLARGTLTGTYRR